MGERRRFELWFAKPLKFTLPLFWLHGPAVNHLPRQTSDCLHVEWIKGIRKECIARAKPAFSPSTRSPSISAERSSFAEKKLAERKKTYLIDSMSDPRNVAHAKKVTQEKKHQGAEARPQDAPAAQLGKKPAATKKKAGLLESAPVSTNTAASESAVPSESPALKPPAALEDSLAVLAQLKEMEFHSRANLERLAKLMLAVDEELKQKELAGALGEVYSAQDAFQTKLTALIEAYRAECDRMQGGSV
jgi:hypothetical protein